MAKKIKSREKNKPIPETDSNYKHGQKEKNSKEDYLWSMSHAPHIDEETHGLQFAPLIFFTAFVIMIVRMVAYTRPMEQLYWTSQGNDLTDFFSYAKMVAIIICACLAILFLLYRVVTQSFAIQRSAVYIPMAAYAVLIILSYAFCEKDYKVFALLGWNDRFEGTLILLAYLVMLFYAINSIKTEKGVKMIIYPLAVTSAILGLLGVTQAVDHDFFRTEIGRKMITPSWYWEHLSGLQFTFEDKQIYQTVYNINYVSFYLTLLIPLFGLIFIRSIMKGKEEALWKKIVWGALFGLLIFNLIGSASSGGFFGMAVVVLVAFIFLNKRILAWWKPVAMLLVITIIIGGFTYDRWLPEVFNSFGISNPLTQQTVPGNPGMTEENKDENSTPSQLQAPEPEDNASQDMDAAQPDESVTAEESAPQMPEESAVKDSKTKKHHIDFMNVLGGHMIDLSIEGNEVVFTLDPEIWPNIRIADIDGKAVKVIDNGDGTFQLNDERFSMCKVAVTSDDNGNEFFVLTTDYQDWYFWVNAEGIYYINSAGKVADLVVADYYGFEGNADFGSGRGYIWSRSFPLIKDTVLIGHGADTFCMYFPQNDYIGKYNEDWGNFGLIIDKPHNMFIGMAIGTGVLSVIAFLAIFLIYVIQSFAVYWRRKYDRFIDYAGAGICLGIIGFTATGMVNDSSVSVMPMFYGLLGTGIAINMILKRNS